MRFILLQIVVLAVRVHGVVILICYSTHMLLNSHTLRLLCCLCYTACAVYSEWLLNVALGIGSAEHEATELLPSGAVTRKVSNIMLLKLSLL
jgi:hypothetical protein